MSALIRTGLGIGIALVLSMGCADFSGLETDWCARTQRCECGPAGCCENLGEACNPGSCCSGFRCGPRSVCVPAGPIVSITPDSIDLTDDPALEADSVVTVQNLTPNHLPSLYLGFPGGNSFVWWTDSGSCDPLPPGGTCEVVHHVELNPNVLGRQSMDVALFQANGQPTGASLHINAQVGTVATVLLDGPGRIISNSPSPDAGLCSTNPCTFPVPWSGSIFSVLPPSGVRFLGWSGYPPCEGSVQTSCRVTDFRNFSLTAHFQ